MSTVPTPVTRTFTVTGQVAGRQVRIVWAEGEGFDDPSGRTAVMIEGKERVHVTVTGPSYDAADHPPVVAFLTAKQAVDVLASVEGGEHLQRELEALAVVPDGATA